MNGLFRRPTDAQAEDEIPEDLLNAIPEIEGEQPAQESSTPFSAFQAKKGSPPASDGKPSAAEADITSVMTEVRKQMESAFAEQLNRIEGTFGSILKDMEGKLAFAQAELEATKRENERVKGEHQRKVEALRELKRTLEKL